MNITSFPLEIIINISSQLHSYDDILNLSSTCKYLRDSIWSMGMMFELIERRRYCLFLSVFETYFSFSSSSSSPSYLFLSCPLRIMKVRDELVLHHLHKLLYDETFRDDSDLNMVMRLLSIYSGGLSSKNLWMVNEILLKIIITQGERTITHHLLDDLDHKFIIDDLISSPRCIKKIGEQGSLVLADDLLLRCSKHESRKTLILSYCDGLLSSKSPEKILMFKKIMETTKEKKNKNKNKNENQNHIPISQFMIISIHHGLGDDKDIWNETHIKNMLSNMNLNDIAEIIFLLLVGKNFLQLECVLTLMDGIDIHFSKETYLESIILSDYLVMVEEEKDLFELYPSSRKFLNKLKCEYGNPPICSALSQLVNHGNIDELRKFMTEEGFSSSRWIVERSIFRFKDLNLWKELISIFTIRKVNPRIKNLLLRNPFWSFLPEKDSEELFTYIKSLHHGEGEEGDDPSYPFVIKIGIREYSDFLFPGPERKIWSGNRDVDPLRYIKFIHDHPDYFVLDYEEHYDDFFHHLIHSSLSIEMIEIMMKKKDIFSSSFSRDFVHYYSLLYRDDFRDGASSASRLSNIIKNKEDEEEEDLPQ